MDKSELTRLKELAENATPGEWVADRYMVLSPKRHNLARTYTHSDGNIDRLEPMDKHDNAAFIAAANPATILAMIAEIERLEKKGQRQKI